MLTLGVDLASQARNTAICRIRWAPENAIVELVRENVDAAPWLELGREVEAALTTDHLFDALVSALNARAAGLGLTHRPPVGDARCAEKEGWIALPIAGSFEKLRGTGA